MAAAPRPSFHGAAVMGLLLFFLGPTVAALSLSSAKTFNGSCIEAEREALFSFKAGVTSDPSRRLRSWRGQDCCHWYGVRCSTRTGHVVKLDLRNDFFQDRYLRGDEQVVNSLGGQISSSLLALRHLKHLDLSGNVLGGGTSIPEFIGSLKSLTYLNLSYINFGGRVLPQLGNLTKLVYLDIQLDDADPFAYSADVSWIARLRSLEYLDMSRLKLSAVVDWVHAVNNLPKLRVLHLSDCELNTSIPSLQPHNFTVLEELDLSGNNFNTPAAPNWYWHVSSLRSLHLKFCGLAGALPHELGNLTMLETLDMGNNNIEGVIPSTMRNLCSLRMIDLSSNNIVGDIRDLIQRLPKCSWNNVQDLNLVESNITGMALKSAFNLSSLRILDIASNQLNGSVPVEIGALKFLTELSIGSNNLIGVISEDHLSGLKNLKRIDLSQTYLQVIVGSDWEPPFKLEEAFLASCHLGPQIPSWLRWQKGILTLSISRTGLVDTIPDWFWTTFSNAKTLDLSYNQISGELPLNLEFMSVESLLLGSNHLTGLVPQLPRSIKLLDVSKNSLSGQLPSNFGAPYLQVAVLFSNSLTGVIPESICRLSYLRLLDFSKNQLTGGIPDCDRKELKQWDRSSSNNASRVNSASSYGFEIRTLLLNNNSLSGGLPLFLKQCSNLMFLDLSQNKFSGNLPAWISEDMPNLVMLRLRSNNFSGHIPIEITRFVNLRILDLANNTFSGVIPQSLVNLEALTNDVTYLPDNPFELLFQVSSYLYVGFGFSDDSLSLVIKGQILEYRENFRFLRTIDLSCNRLAGQIPEQIGSLLGLINLNLSSNFLRGNIPYKIGNLRSLESLDLSNNKFSGEIPWALSNLTSLSYLNLSYNKLCGRIPSGRQLDILKVDDPASMYIGNPCLCGHPLRKVCPGDQAAQEYPIRRHGDDKSQMDFHLGLIVGFLVALWIIFCGLLFKRTWRYAYFRLLDKLYDKFYIFSVVTWQKWFGKCG